MLAFAQIGTGLRATKSSLTACGLRHSLTHRAWRPLDAKRHMSSSAPTRGHVYMVDKDRKPVPRKQVAAVIIGNEILSGKTLDTNLGTLARHVDARGAVLARAATIRDDIEEIARVVHNMSTHHDLVFTSGGIGPTLDDVTYAGVAAAFDGMTGRHEETVKRMHQVQPGLELNEARLRMAQLPIDCETLWTPDLWVPLAVVRNVYVLPGIPRLFEKMLQSVPDERFGDVERRARAVVLCERAEGDLAALLVDVADRFDVALGSYPATTEAARKKYRSMVTVEGDFADVVREAAEIVRQGVDGRFDTEPSV